MECAIGVFRNVPNLGAVVAVSTQKYTPLIMKVQGKLDQLCQRFFLEKIIVEHILHTYAIFVYFAFVPSHALGA